MAAASRRQLLSGMTALGASVLLARLASADEAAPATIRWSPDKDGVHGQITAEGSALLVWSRLERVEDWPSLFSDIRALEVKKREGNRWLLRLVTRSARSARSGKLDLNPPARRADLALDAGAIAVRVKVAVSDGAAADLSTVDLWVSTSGVLGWFVSDKTLRQKQAAIAERYLLDLQSAFRKIAPA
jgi:hypothetical protein